MGITQPPLLAPTLKVSSMLQAYTARVFVAAVPSAVTYVPFHQTACVRILVRHNAMAAANKSGFAATCEALSTLGANTVQLIALIRIVTWVAP